MLQKFYNNLGFIFYSFKSVPGLLPKRWMYLFGIILVFVVIFISFIIIRFNRTVPVSKPNNTTPPAQTTPIVNAPPSPDIQSVTLTAKQDAADTYSFTATVNSTVAITKVEFYAGNKLIGEVTKAPYSLSVHTNTLPEGTVNIVAVAYDSSNKTKASSPLQITVKRTQPAASSNPPPSAPASGTTPPPPSSPPAPTTPYVQPGTQGYKGSLGSLTVYSAENGLVPPGQGCSWDMPYKVLDCRGTNLTLDHVYVKGGIYWDGCGSLTISNSIIEWAPSRTWHNIHAACDNGNAGATLTVTRSTLRASADGTPYTGSVDIGGTDVGPLNTGSARPMIVSNSLLQHFPQGLNPPGNSVIKNNEIYTADVWCDNSNEWCHSDGLYSQGGDNITYEGNYVVAQIDPIEATAAIFFQSSPRSSGHRIIGNYLKGGAFTFYNQTADNITVENNTFGGYKFGDVSNSGTILSWANNKRENGTIVPSP